jgi:hypothetical protein
MHTYTHIDDHHHIFSQQEGANTVQGEGADVYQIVETHAFLPVKVFTSDKVLAQMAIRREYNKVRVCVCVCMYVCMYERQSAC